MLASAEMRPAIIAPKPKPGEPLYTTTIRNEYETLCPTGISTATTHITTKLPVTFTPSSISVVMTSTVADCTMCGPGSTKVTLSVPHETFVPLPSTGTGLGHKTPKFKTILPIVTGVPPASSGAVPSGTGNLPRTSLPARPPYPVGHNSSSLLAEATALSGTAPPASTPVGTGSLPAGASSVSISLFGTFTAPNPTGSSVSISLFGTFTAPNPIGTGSSGTALAPPPSGTGKPSYDGSKGDVTKTVVQTEIVTMTKPVETTTVATSTVTVTVSACEGRHPNPLHVRNWLWR